MKTFSITFLLAFFFSFSLFAQSVTEQFITNNENKYNEAEAIIEIEKIYQKLLKGEKFEDLVLKYSQDNAVLRITFISFVINRGCMTNLVDNRLNS